MRVPSFSTDFFFMLLPMGVCSLLSNDIGQQRHSIEPICE